MTTTADPGRVESLEAQIRDLQAVYAQLDAYAKDLNRTYLELRLRLQQMTTLSALATRLAGARNVDACIRICADGIIDLFPDSVSAIYLEDHHEALKLVAARPHDDAPTDLFDGLAAEALCGDEPMARHIQQGGQGQEFVAMPLRTRGKSFGAIVVLRQQQFDEDDLRVMDLMANSAAVTIANARLYQQTRRLAITDPTTGLFNLRQFRTALAQEIQKAKRFKYPIAVIMADIDNFKAFNDSFGHPKGNVALRKIAQTILQNLRQTDLVARYGGEEFAAILPGCDQLALLQVAEKVRQAVERLSFPVGPDRPRARLTLSIGGAWQAAPYTDAATLLSAADQALYEAKERGRNRSYIRPD
ncbi:MAG TPA: sensor domain-containing diguanylate cyclase [Chloroflexota bacterium]|nr:sensor domain-containing diguanylate cyclase [Chloroflexota bacterium]